MGRINWISDLGAPILVAVADIAVETKKSEWAKWVHYGGAVAGYGLALTGYAGKYSQAAMNVGIASLPLAARDLYEQFGSPLGTISSRGRGRVSSSPKVTRMIRSPGPISRTYEPEFKKVGVV